MNELALFAGAGGGILGGVLCGWRTVAAVEIEEYPRAVLLQRQADGILPCFPVWDDVCTFDGKPWRGKVDVISGGFPCQDISAAGKGAGITGERSGLWKEFARIIGEVRPSFVLVENSPMLVGRGLGVVLADLAEMGYDAEWGVIGAHHAGAPHKRDRIWILATNTNLLAGSTEQKREHQRAEKPTGSRPQRMAAGADVADTLRDGSQGRGQDGPTAGSTGLCHGAGSDEEQYLFNAASAGLPHRTTEPMGEPGADAQSKRSDWWAVEPGLGGVADELANRLDIFGCTPEEEVPRVAKGIKKRVDRLKAIGNGQVSAVVKLAWETLRGE